MNRENETQEVTFPGEGTINGKDHLRGLVPREERSKGYHRQTNDPGKQEK